MTNEKTTPTTIRKRRAYRTRKPVTSRQPLPLSPEIFVQSMPVHFSRATRQQAAPVPRFATFGDAVVYSTEKTLLRIVAEGVDEGITDLTKLRRGDSFLGWFGRQLFVACCLPPAKIALAEANRAFDDDRSINTSYVSQQA